MMIVEYFTCLMKLYLLIQKRAKKSSAKLDEHETRAADDDPMQDIVIEPLTQKTVQTGMVILG